MRFESANDVDLIAHRDDLVRLLKESYGEDFCGAHLAKCDDGSYLEIIVWGSKEAADRAAHEMPSDPRAAGFFSQIGNVHEMRHAEVLHSA
ncbi:DUF1428 domain-containing protein [Rhodococcus marinonascens]|uniref:DUF1428 domain-containing protein n=1 Tax=Rhodococcus marinonascens TaxID=38311 RepID=UPI001C3F79E3|nr:DUF1428 domain-containing protein [Rhodococcus marinonascens]